MPNRPLRLAVFIVDDESSILLVLRRSLGARYQVITETSGKKALEILCSPQEFDAVLLDLLMPDMNGPGIFAQLKNRAPERLKRMVLVSAAPQLFHDFLNEAGMPVLAKPFSIEQVEGAIERFRHSKAGRGPRQPSLHDLSLQEDDGEEEITTGMVLTHPPPSNQEPDDHDSYHLQIKWLSQKHNRLARNVKETRDDVQETREEIRKVDKKVDTIHTKQDTVLSTLRWIGIAIGIVMAAVKAYEHFFGK